MKRIFPLLFFISLAAKLIAQPGLGSITKNINDVTDEDIGRTHSTGSYQYTFVIDSSSDLSKLNMLNSLYAVTLRVKLRAVPKEIYRLSARLKELDISCAERYTVDISSLRLLKNLTKLRINGDFKEESIQGLTNLTDISFYNYGGTKLPDMQQLDKLTSLTIWYGKVKNIGAVSNCRSLKNLSLYHLDSLKELNVDMSKLNLELLTISSYSLKSISGLSTCRMIKTLELDGVSPLKTLDLDMSNMDVENLSLQYCRDLEDISAISKCKSLKTLNIVVVSGLRKLNFDMNSTDLQSLSIKGLADFVGESASHLKDIDSIVSCRSLKVIELSALDSLESLDFSNHATALQRLHVVKCKLLTHIDGLSASKGLRELFIGENPQLVKIPDLKNELSVVNNVFVHDNKKLKIANFSVFDARNNKHWNIGNNGSGPGYN